jgi:hypothetical protein
MDEIDEVTGLPRDDIELSVLANIEGAGTPSEAIQAAVNQVEVKTRKDGKPIGHKPLPFDVEVAEDTRDKPTPRMIAMANFIVDGMSPSDAYRKSYNADKSNDETVRQRRTKLCETKDLLYFYSH